MSANKYLVRPTTALFSDLRGKPFQHVTGSNLDYYMTETGDTLTIYFAESNKFDRDWNDNLWFFHELFDGVKVHGGIVKQYLSIRNMLLDRLYSGRFKKIIVLGYSLGGALTQLCVQDLGYHIERDKVINPVLRSISVFGISFDSPRVFCRSVKVKPYVKDRLLVIKTRNDPVPHLPGFVMFAPLSIRVKKPIGIRFAPPWKWLSLWADYGEVRKIGKWYRFLPIQHRPEQIIKALRETFG